MHAALLLFGARRDYKSASHHLSMRPALPFCISLAIALASLPYSSLAASNGCKLIPPPWSYPTKLSVAVDTINQSSTRMPSLRHTQVIITHHPALPA
jgi:hypothetical protein